MHDNYITPQAATAAAAALLRHRQNGRTSYRPKAKHEVTGLWPTTNGHTQPWSAV